MSDRAGRGGDPARGCRSGRRPGGAPADRDPGRRPAARRRPAGHARRGGRRRDGRPGRGRSSGTATARCPRGSTAVACALPAGREQPIASRALEAGVPFASSGDDESDLDGLRSLTETARRSGVAIIAGCGLAPGLSDVLARHAADAFDEVDEIGVARSGTAGDACVATASRALRERPARAARRRVRGVAPVGRPRAVWFPEPLGPQECERVATGVTSCSAAVPRRGPDHGAASPGPESGPPAQRWLRRRDPEGTWGAIRVEVWGRRGAAREPIVYGAIERTAIAAGTVLGVTTAALAGALPGLLKPSAGVFGLGLGRRAAGVPRRAVPAGREGRDLRGRSGRLGARRSGARGQTRLSTGARPRRAPAVARARSSAASTVSQSVVGDARAGEHRRVEELGDRVELGRDERDRGGPDAARTRAWSRPVTGPGPRSAPRRVEPRRRGCAAHVGATRRAAARRAATDDDARSRTPTAAATSRPTAARRSRSGARSGRSGRRARRLPAASMAESPARGTDAVGSKPCQPMPGK